MASTVWGPNLTVSSERGQERRSDQLLHRSIHPSLSIDHPRRLRKLPRKLIIATCRDKFKRLGSVTSHVTRRPSLKRLSGIQVQLLINITFSKSLRFHFIFEITNEIGQLCYKCCFFCSNSIVKAYFSGWISRCTCAVLNARLRALIVSIATATYNGSCSDTLTLPINHWLFHSEGGASCDRAAILRVAFFPIQNYTSDMS